MQKEGQRQWKGREVWESQRRIWVCDFGHHLRRRPTSLSFGNGGGDFGLLLLLQRKNSPGGTPNSLLAY